MMISPRAAGGIFIMRKLGLFLIIALALGLTAVTARPAAAQASGLNGVWLGDYGYGDNRPAVKFQVKLRSDGARLSGGTIEANTFGDATALFLTAMVSGAVDGDGSVRFTKTYDGTGGQTHSVQYSGKLDPTGRCVHGAWVLGHSTGPFEMCAEARLLS
jgi:hypothetical protein